MPIGVLTWWFGVVVIPGGCLFVVWGAGFGLGCGLGSGFGVSCCLLFCFCLVVGMLWLVGCCGDWLLDLVACYCCGLVDAQFVTLVVMLVGFTGGLAVGVFWLLSRLWFWC